MLILVHTICYLIVEVVFTEGGDEVVDGQGGHLWNLVALAHEAVEILLLVCVNIVCK